MAKGRIQGTSRADEEKHLEKTLAVIRGNMEEYGRQVSEMQADIDEMLEHYHDNDVEVYTMLSNTITMHDHMKRALVRNEKALKKPYFGRIDFKDAETDQDETLYIGRGGIARDATHQEVIDWRAPVANAYYENGLGKCGYLAPDGTGREIDLKRKRTYEIADGTLLDYFDSEVISNDELLTKYLARSKQAVLGEIVATIQKEQNEIIRRSPYHNVIVQGAAGSGKTTVAMHRISYILYNYAERFRPEDFYIVGSNRILLNYITGVLPDLDVHGVRQMTMEQLFVRLLYEEWDGKKYRIRKSAQGPETEGFSRKGDADWFRDLETFLNELERKTISDQSIYLNPRQFVEGIQDGKSGIHDKSTADDPLILLMDGDAVKRYLDQNPHISIQSKINMLNERLSKKLQEEFLGKGIKYTDEEKKAILKAYRNRYGSGKWSISSYRLYRDFLLRQASKGMSVETPDREFDVCDLAALAYIYHRTRETEVISEAHHIVVDEAQDFGMMVWHCLNACVRGCTYTIMGDVSQNIHFGFGLNDWESLKKLFLPDPADHFDTLRKSYRNTIEISHFAAAILNHGRFFRYPSEPIIRHGQEPQVCPAPAEELLRRAAEVCRDWQERGLATIALICRTERQARDVVKALSPMLPLSGTDLETAEFGSGVMVLPVEYTKGLEFDAVLILNPTREDYPVDDGHARLLYVAATRALHELCVLHTGDLTGLIADPAPEEAAPACSPEDENGGEANADSRTEIGGEAKTVGETDPEPKTGSSENGSRPRPRARAVIKPAVSHATPEHAKPRTSYTEKPMPTSAPAAALKGTSKPSAPDSAAPGRSPAPENRKASYEDRAEKKVSGVCPAFGTPVPDRELILPGHTRADLAVRWVTKDKSAVRLQSRYGILCIRPVTAKIVRISFAQDGGRLTDSLPPSIVYDGSWRSWTCRETSAAVELASEKFFLRVSKATGSLCCCNREKKELFSEKERESRLVEDRQNGWKRSRLFLKSGKTERLFALGGEGKDPVDLRGDARYITPDKGSWPDGRKRPAFICSDRGYGLLIPADGPVFFCDRPSKDAWLCADVRGQTEMYVIVGNSRDELENACRLLCGRL